ncbi:MULTISPECIES: methyltransferase [Oxalobacteraceae]|jgi:release factor glutamine methyltransferase|uniref:methyltransferase n=1 Tax=Oxalobacteraceae TaxID=75682 RepID=UPI002C0391A5|nr:MULTISPECIES: methyltransferase [Oxalobacteraceae]HTD03296.1 methyltransferase [Undibacterium sp.]HWW06602.1 methyltransferase [Collimonas sp.]
MLGLNDKSWLVEKFYETHYSKFSDRHQDNREKLSTYDTYFGMGHSIRLIDEPGVFKISPAGLALGNYMLKTLRDDELKGGCLDIGTGGGVLAILLRDMGAEDIVGTDISAAAVDLAIRNEMLNFGDNKISFAVSDLFYDLPNKLRKFGTVIFNPPGWRTPSDDLLKHLTAIDNTEELAPSAMFYGDRLLLDFLQELPSYLQENGRAIIGLNSLVGIKDVLMRYRNKQCGACPLQFRLLERYTFPLLFYSEHWKKIASRLREEFSQWQERHQAAYSLDSKGNLYWSYELVECIWNRNRMGRIHG